VIKVQQNTGKRLGERDWDGMCMDWLWCMHLFYISKHQSF